MTPSIYHGPQGISGPPGMTGSVGVQGPQGMTGDDMNDVVWRQYEHEGFEMRWRMKDGSWIRIKNMEDSHVKNCINMLRRNEPTETRKAWIEVFSDVIVKRRRLKLDKIMKKI